MVLGAAAYTGQLGGGGTAAGPATAATPAAARVPGTHRRRDGTLRPGPELRRRLLRGAVAVGDPSETASESPSPTPTKTSGEPTANELEDAITRYYGLVPGDTDAAWAC